jgi:LacI family transcriptional regulator
MPREDLPADSPRMTLRKLAKVAGLSLSAVSMALRNHPDIAPKTRTRVRALARELGYHPDPKMASLMRHLRKGAASEYRETIGFLSSYANYDEWKTFSQHDYYLGARARANELGYRLEIFHWGAPGLSQTRLSQMLIARGIRGLLISASRPKTRLQFAWDHFAAVSFGYSLASPMIHRATSDHYFAMVTALRNLTKKGFRRIGFNVNEADDAKVLGLWRSCYALYQQTHPVDQRIPINMTRHGCVGLDGWLRLNKPDAIISSGCDFPIDYEAAHRRPAPRNITYVNLNICRADERSGGIDTDSYAVGQLAVGHLVTMLQRNETGLPKDPQTLSILGKWIEDHQAWARERGDLSPSFAAYFKKRSRAAASRSVALVSGAPAGRLTDEEWARIKHLLPGRTGSVGAPARDNRLFVDALLYRHRERISWRKLPASLGDFRVVHSRYKRWERSGLWSSILKALGNDSI